jgi:hypothetical protein
VRKSAPAVPTRADALPPARERADEVRTEQQAETDANNRLLRSAKDARQNVEAAAVEPPPVTVGTLAETAAVAGQLKGGGFAPLDTAAPTPAAEPSAPLESSVPANRFVRWRVVGRRNIERSVDGGVTWVRTTTPPVVSAGTPGVTIINVLAIDPQTARITISTGSVFSTSDAGETWVPVQEKPAAPF